MSPLGLELTQGFDAVVDLDATFELVALDRNGNESQSSEPFRVAFDGCTTAPGVDGCVEDLPTPVVCSGQGCWESASESCSLSLGPGASRRAGATELSIGVLGLAFWIGCLALLRRRRR